MVYIGVAVSESAKNTLRQQIGDEQLCFGTIPKDEEAQWPAELCNCEVLVAWGSRITETVIARLPKLRWIHSVSAGVDSVPFARLRERGILLSNSRGLHGHPISEQVMGTLIAFSRGLHVFWQNQREQRWERSYTVDELTGKTLLIVGAGSIGRELARKAKAFDMVVLGVRSQAAPLPNFDAVHGIEEIEKVLPHADFVVVLTPLTDKTYHLISTPQLSVMKSTAILLNYARGPVVDEHALVNALQTHQIKGASLDVFETEPLPADHPLWTLDGVLLTPHTGGWSPHHDEREVALFLSNWEAFQRKARLPTSVDLERQY